MKAEKHLKKNSLKKFLKIKTEIDADFKKSESLSVNNAESKLGTFCVCKAPSPQLQLRQAAAFEIIVVTSRENICPACTSGASN